MAIRRFKTMISRTGAQTYIAIPFDPDEAWGVKERHYVAGSIGEHPFRGCLDCDKTPCVLPIGAAWLRDNDLDDAAAIEIVLEPDGPQIENLPPDIADALIAEPRARACFDSFAPFYRKNYLRWIEDARRPETRSKRIAEAIKSLKAGKKR